ncbi:MAG: glycosyltransferase family 4 protein [Bacilli bacterium]|nr:glycosyltransferase family 4 protein [Bacilli bacterium]MDD4733539.1 glycosyltransferase family 4 protein [Bacilli bacterium]
MKILFLGDYKANTGPSNVNKNLKEYLPKNVIYINSSKKIFRIIEIFIKAFLSNVIIISGHSKSNRICINISKIFGRKKKILNIQHGSASYENETNNLNNKKMVIEEKYLLDNVDLILCVSENFMKWFKNYSPQYSHKTSYLNNGVDWGILDKEKNKTIINKEPNTIITMGGGRPQKNNVMICEAIKILNEEKNKKYKLIVLGRDYEDTEKIKSYNFVDYVGQVKYEEACYYLKKSSIFIQNSSLESFGLATIEALLSGCNILVSKNVGAISILTLIDEIDIIGDCNNPNEIASKILYLSKNPNNKRIIRDLDKNKTSYKYAANRLMEIVRELVIKE